MTPAGFLRSLCLGWLFGIAVASFGIPIWVAVLVMIALGAFPKQTTLAFLPAVIAFTGGVFLYLESGPSEHSVRASVGQEVQVEARVARVEGRERLEVIGRQVQVNDISVENRILLFTDPWNEILPGDKVSFTCSLEAPEPFDGFRYDRYLATKDVYALCMRPRRLTVEDGAGLATKLREAFTDRVDHIYGVPQGTLLNGLLLGEKEFSDAWSSAFQKTGTSHIVAASGYNVTMFATVIFGFLLALSLRRKSAGVVLIGAIFAYVWLAGGDPPVLRAGLMATLVVVARIFGRRSGAEQGLLLTACAMLLMNPYLLRDDVAFQLSFLSTAGLLYLTKPVGERLDFLPEAFGIRESVASTISATVATFPIIALQFGTFSIIALFVNALVLPLVPMTMALGALSVPLSFVPILSLPLSAMTDFLLRVILFIISTTADLPFATVPLSFSTPLAILLWFIVILLLWLGRNSSRSFSSSR